MLSSQRLVHISFKSDAYHMFYASLETLEEDLSNAFISFCSIFLMWRYSLNIA